MIKVSIKRNGIETNASFHETQELADQWLSRESANGSFGQDFEVEIVDISAQVAQEAVNVAALRLLADTDWLIVREVETGVACPAEVKAERAAARAAIIRA